MARSDPASPDRYRVDRQSLRTALGSQIRRTFGHHIRPGSSVHIRHVESTRGITGIQNPSYHGLPSTIERPGRKVPQVVESGIEGQVNDAVMDGRATLGHAGTEDHAEGGFGHVGCGDGLWINVDGTRNFCRT